MTTFTVTVKRLDGEKSTIQICETDTILQLKINFSQKIGIDVEQLRLIYKGTPLRDNMSVKETGVQRNDTIHIILQLNG